MLQFIISYLVLNLRNRVCRLKRRNMVTDIFQITNKARKTVIIQFEKWYAIWKMHLLYWFCLRIFRYLHFKFTPFSNPKRIRAIPILLCDVIKRIWIVSVYIWACVDVIKLNFRQSAFILSRGGLVIIKLT